MFRTKLFRMALIVTILAALFAVPMAAGAQMENGLDVAEGAVVSGTVDITGYADASNFEKWDLYVFPNGDENAKIFLANGTDAGEFSATVDTTNFPDGDHVLSLRVVDATTGNYQEYLVPFTIANAGAEAAAETPAAEASSTMTETVAMTDTVAMTETVEAPAATAAPVNGFDLEDGVEVSGTVTVTGYADTVGFTKWQLDVIPFGNTDDAIFLAYGEDAGAFSQEVDTTNYPDGDHQLRLRVVDDTGNYSEYFVDVTVANGGAEEAAAAEVVATPAVTETETTTATATTTATVAAPEAAPAETTAMTNGLDVQEGAVVSGTVDITGYADAPNFEKWDLYVFPNGDENAKIFLANGTDAGEFSATVDTTNFPDGDHVLSLRVVDATTGNYQEYLVPFTIANAAAS